MRIATLLALLPSLALAGSVGSGSIIAGAPAGTAPGSIAQTTGAMTLYVSTAGSDSYPCTAADAGCLTPGGALAKLPRLINNIATINIEDGTYDHMNISGFYFADGGSLVVNGSLITSTVPAQADGGIKTIVNTAVPVPSIADSQNTFVASALKGYIVRLTSGASSGQRRIVVDNTATVMTLNRQYASIPSANDGYILEEPGVVLNGATRPFDITSSYGNGALSATNTIFVTGIRVTGSCQVYNNGANIIMTSMRCVNAAGAPITLANNTGSLTLVNSYFQGASASSVTSSNSLVSNTNGGPMFSSSASGYALTVTNAQGMFAGGAVIDNTNSTGSALQISDVGRVSSSFTGGTQNWQLRCASGSTGSVGLGVLTGKSGPLVNVNISNCVTGVSVVQEGAVLLSVTGVTTATTAFSVSGGGKIFFNASTAATLSAVTNPFSIDGVIHSAADLAGANVLSNFTFGSAIYE